MVDGPPGRTRATEDERDDPAAARSEKADHAPAAEPPPDQPTVVERPGSTQVPAALGPVLTVAGGALTLLGFFFLPALDPPAGIAPTGRDLAGALGALWWVPVVAVLLIGLGALPLLGRRVPRAGPRPWHDVAVVVLAGFVALGLVALLVSLGRTAVGARLYLQGVDPAGTAASGYWLMLLGVGAALAAGSRGLLLDRAAPARGRLLLAGAGLGVVAGAIVASFLLDARLQDAQSVVVLGVAAEETGPDFATGNSVVRTAPDAATLRGDAERLYSGMYGTPACRRDELAAFLTSAGPTRRDAWRFAADGLSLPLAEDVTTLTPLVLRYDTRVTAHRFDGDHVVPYQSVLPAGTAVLVDRRGVPRVRCSGAAPLAAPRTAAASPRFVGAAWAGFYPGSVVTVRAAPSDVVQFGVLAEPGPFRRPAGSMGERDVVEVTSEGLLDGLYNLDGRLVECQLGDCDTSQQLRASLSVAGCPQQCRVTSPGLWKDTVELRRSGDRYTAEGRAFQDYTCGSNTQPTTTSVDLRVTTSSVVEGVWTVIELSGTVRTSSPAGECTAGLEVFEAAVSW